MPSAVQRVSSRRVIRSLQLLLAATLVIPLLTFGIAVWNTRQTAFANAERDIARAADVGREHAARVLDTYRLAVDRIKDLIDDLTEEQIRQSEPELHRQVREIIANLPQVQSAYVIDREGRAVLSGTVFPAPQDSAPAADRDFFLALRAGGPPVHVSKVHIGRLDKTSFFAVSKRRNLVDGKFNGLVNVSAVPEHIADFYGTLIDPRIDTMALVRDDGEVLARHPTVDETAFPRPTADWFLEAVATAAEAGLVRASSSMGNERLFRYRRVGGYPLYVVVGRSSEAILAEWRRGVAGMLAWGFPVTLALFGLALLAQRRAQAEQIAVALAQAERDRRGRAEAALRQAEKMEALGRLTGGVAHDFNNILAAMSSVMRLLTSLGASGRQQELIASGQQTIERGQELTKKLLMFARQQPLKIESLDINGRIRDCLPLIRHTMRQDYKSIRAELRLADDLWPAQADATQLDMAILNIAANARDAMPDGGTFTIATQNMRPDGGELTGDFVAIGLSDTGTGMPPEVLAHVFEPFFTTKAAGKGTGLGLSSVYGFAVQSGGTVTIDSHPGGGTTVTLLLPKAVPRSTGYRTGEGSAPEHGTGSASSAPYPMMPDAEPADAVERAPNLH